MAVPRVGAGKAAPLPGKGFHHPVLLVMLETPCTGFFAYPGSGGSGFLLSEPCRNGRGLKMNDAG